MFLHICCFVLWEFENNEHKILYRIVTKADLYTYILQTQFDTKIKYLAL